MALVIEWWVYNPAIRYLARAHGTTYAQASHDFGPHLVTWGQTNVVTLESVHALLP